MNFTGERDGEREQQKYKDEERERNEMLEWKYKATELERMEPELKIFLRFLNLMKTNEFFKFEASKNVNF